MDSVGAKRKSELHLKARCTGLQVAPLAAVFVALASASCAGAHEASVRADLDRGLHTFGRGQQELAAAATPGPTLEEYLAYAALQNPALRASFERWRASVHRISSARRLPDPMLEFGAFVWNSGDNAGLTPGRAGLRQEFPWPTKLTAGADAASAEARALQRRFEAQRLEIRRRVTQAYFRLWLLRRMRAIEKEQLEILRGLSQSALGQLATGAASLADQLQIDLSAARLADTVAALDQQERSAEAQLRAAVGAPVIAPTPTPDVAVSLALPDETDEALREAILTHPFIESFGLMGQASEAMARGERAARWPGFAIGVEWMRMPGRMGASGIMPTVGLRLPLWQGSYKDSVRAAEAEATAQRSEGRAAAQTAYAALDEALAMVRDALRRAELNENTLLPQAQAAYESVLGAYVTGRSTVASSLLAQRELLEIRIALEQARAEHASAWARLEEIVGRSVKRQELAHRREP